MKSKIPVLFKAAAGIGRIHLYKFMVDAFGGINEALVMGVLLSDDREKVEKNGVEYIPIRRDEWYELVRLTPKQYDLVIKKLREKGFVDTKVFKNKDNDLATHICVNENAVNEALQRVS